MLVALFDNYHQIAPSAVIEFGQRVIVVFNDYYVMAAERRFGKEEIVLYSVRSFATAIRVLHKCRILVARSGAITTQSPVIIFCLNCGILFLV